MGSGMITTMVIALAFFMIGSDNFHVATAATCGADLSGLVNECERYVDNAGPPSQSCCDLIRPIDCLNNNDADDDVIRIWVL
ncbi:unnamed protein product [Arabis nemorensis]|uniref:Bifunctional inhibitor/plant lipid transfer protein/seed storage helical domain-containing protein n=1 Tax=Arabis nemorensis TaxID=586526 RepID=A0A565CA49_9BRAS|nr:unnamed protein product [Arabis nemorensis]